jgi:hypothetical protein
MVELTISAGGNDVGLASILNDCIFGWWPQDAATCEATMQTTQNKIDNQLPTALGLLLSAALKKITPTTGRIYVTGYAKFFNPDDQQCNSVTWSVWKAAKDKFKQPLDTARRKKLNDLVDATNAKIQAAVENAGSQVVFVNYDPYFTSWGGLYCEPGVIEPDYNRDYLLFYERYTTDGTFPFKVKRDDPTSDPNDVVPDGSFEGEVASWIEETLTQNPSWQSDLQYGEFEEIQNGTASPNSKLAIGGLGQEDIALLGGISWWLPDSVKRVFHPQPNGHAIIANLVLYHMEGERAAQLGYATVAEQQSLNSCPRDPFNPAAYPVCLSNSVPYVPSQLKNPSDGTIMDANGLLIKLRQASCTNACDIPPDLPAGIVVAFQNADKTNCEISVALPNNVEAWTYRGTPSTGTEWQNCWDSFYNIIDQCVKEGPNTGWVNGPDAYEFFVSCPFPFNAVVRNAY